jgi:hypothetical protein
LNPIAVVEATRKAVAKEGEYFVLVLDFYLKNRCGMGLELAAHDRRKFQRAMANLIGEVKAERLGASIDSELKKSKRRQSPHHQQG